MIPTTTIPIIYNVNIKQHGMSVQDLDKNTKPYTQIETD